MAQPLSAWPLALQVRVKRIVDRFPFLFPNEAASTRGRYVIAGRHDTFTLIVTVMFHVYTFDENVELARRSDRNLDAPPSWTLEARDMATSSAYPLAYYEATWDETFVMLRLEQHCTQFVENDDMFDMEDYM